MAGINRLWGARGGAWLAAGLIMGPAAWAQVPVVPERGVPPVTPSVPLTQTPVVPEIVEPRQAPTLPPGAGGDRGLSTPRSESPLAPLDGARPVPDAGVLAPPPPGSSTVIPPPATGDTPVIRPPATGGMPVITPPGSPGGDRSVVPR